ncbi:MAG TPA: ribosomal L7Ae/L30e/S12e/Gadd45 family protein [Fervidobacterium nodosum]|nr:ribosomal L7Ae/L30e/S12e/Gadd45 family protein [Fervidobacterium nodosum]
MNISESGTSKILTYLGFAAKSGKLVYGKDMIREYITDPKIQNKLIIIATDAGPRVKKDLKIRCEINNVKYFEILEKSTLSKATGMKEVSALGITDENLSKAIVDVLRGEQNVRGKDTNGR